MQQATRKWINIERWHAPHAVTLTLKQRIQATDGSFSMSVPITTDSAAQNFRHFTNVLNQRVYGSAAQRHGKRLPVIPVLEGSALKRLHYHALIDCPRDDLLATFPSLIVRTWMATQWGYNENQVIPSADTGWINYMTKLRDKPDFGTDIDWLNFRNF